MEHSTKKTKSTSSPTRGSEKRPAFKQINVADLIQLARVAPDRLNSHDVAYLQRKIGNQAVMSLLEPKIQRAPLNPALTSPPAYYDGLSLDGIIKSAVHKPVYQRKNNPNQVQKWEARNPGLTYVKDASNAMWLKTGDIHGNEVMRDDGNLPDDGSTSFKEYDIAKYVEGQSRGGERVIIGTKDSTKTYYYTSDHYTTFAPFTP